MSDDPAVRHYLDLEALEALPPDKRRLALDFLKQQHRGHQNNPLWRFDPLDPNGCGIPHTKQHQWLAAHTTPDGRRTKRRIFIGGNRSGKTTGSIVADIIDCIDRDAVPPHLQQYKVWEPPVKMFLVVVDNRNAETVAIPKLRDWCPKDQLQGGSFARAYSKELNRLHFKNGSWIQVMTQKMEIDAFSGADLHRVHFDEEPLYDHGRAIYSECMARLIDHNGDMLLSMTPLLGMTWVYDELFLPWQRQVGEAAESGFAEVQDAPTYMTLVEMDDNPTLDPEGKAATMATFKTEEERQARMRGRFVSFSGRIYDGFDPSVHILPDADIMERVLSPRCQMKVVGLDPGFRHQAGAVWVAMDDEGVYVFSELGLQETIVGSVANQIHLRNQALELVPDLYVADPAIMRRDHQTGKSDRDAYAEAGIYTALGVNDVRPGINVIRGLIAEGKFFMAASCTELKEQFIRYRWVTPKRSEHAPRDTPVKRDDHLLDALRYAVLSLPLPEARQVRDTRPRHQRLMDAESKRLVKGSTGFVHSPFGSGYFTA